MSTDDGILDLRGPMNAIAGRVTKHGAFGFVRTQAMATASGRRLCSNGKYPCTHRGVDLAADEGTEVLAPEHGWVLYAVDGDDVRPFSRYGPALVVLAGASGYYHLIAHLAHPNPFGDYRVLGKLMPTAQRLSRPAEPAYQGDAGTDYGVPENMMPSYEIDPGQTLGYVSDARHVHWEVRKEPKDKLTTMNPIEWLASRGAGPLTPSSGGGAGLLLLAAAYLYGRRKR